MNFQRGRKHEELDMNLIPLIDVLLVIIIFLVVSATFSRINELQINLPTANAAAPQEKPVVITVAVDAGGDLHPTIVGVLARSEGTHLSDGLQSMGEVEQDQTGADLAIIVLSARCVDVERADEVFLICGHLNEVLKHWHIVLSTRWGCHKEPRRSGVLCC